MNGLIEQWGMANENLINTTVPLLVSYTDGNTYTVLGFMGVIDDIAQCNITRTSSSFSVSSVVRLNGTQFWLTIGYQYPIANAYPKPLVSEP